MYIAYVYTNVENFEANNFLFANKFPDEESAIDWVVNDIPSAIQTDFGGEGEIVASVYCCTCGDLKENIHIKFDNDILTYLNVDRDVEDNLYDYDDEEEE